MMTERGEVTEQGKVTARRDDDKVGRRKSVAMRKSS